MKILGARIFDPTLDDVLESPILVVKVDEFPSETSNEISFDDGWRTAKYGPFVRYSCIGLDGVKEEVDAGNFNIRFAGQPFAPVVDIELDYPHSTCPICGKFACEHDAQTVSYEFSLPVTRARQLVRKYCKDWRLYLSDKDAQEGAMVWVPQEVDPVCHYFLRNPRKMCGESKTTYVRYKGVDLPLCPEHLTEHNSRCAEARRSYTSK